MILTNKEQGAQNRNKCLNLAFASCNQHIMCWFLWGESGFLSKLHSKKGPCQLTVGAAAVEPPPTAAAVSTGAADGSHLAD